MRIWIRRPGVSLVLAALAATFAGCDGGSPLNRGAAPAAVAQPESVSELVLVLPGMDSSRYNLWARVAQAEAGQARLIFNIARPEPTDPPARQAELIREAAGRGVAALVVVPDASADLGPALADARERGIVVVALDGSVESAGAPFPSVEMTPLAESAEAMVGKLIQDAQAADLPIQGPARIISFATFDPGMVAARAAALREALEHSGVTVLPDAVLEASGGFLRQMTEMIEVEDRPNMILATDDQILSSAIQYRAELKVDEQPRLLIAGFADSAATLDAVQYGLLNSGTDTNLRRPAVEAVRLALDGLRGEPIPDRVVVPAPIRVAVGPPRSENFPTLRDAPREMPRGSSDDMVQPARPGGR